MFPRSTNNRTHFRAFPRPLLNCKVVLYRSEWSSDHPIVAYTRDLGNGGLFVATGERLDVGQHLQLVVSAPATWEPLILDAEVRWVQKSLDDRQEGAGLCFLNLSEKQLGALRNFTDSAGYDS